MPWRPLLIGLLLLWTAVACQSGPTLEAKAQQAEAENRPEDALKLYRRACEKEVFTSCLRLGRLLSAGQEAGKNEAEAVKVWSRACEAQLPEACAEAARVLARTPAGSARAQELDQKACALGHQASCVEWALRAIEALGDLSHAPEEKKMEYGTVFAGLRKACGAGERRGCEFVCKRTYSTVDENSCVKACDLGSAPSCHVLAQGRLWAEKRDLKGIQALETKACEGGEPMACLSLVRGARRGWFKGTQPVAALARRACGLGDCSAACELGDAPSCHTEARRLADKGDRESSEAYAALACERGVKEACQKQPSSEPAEGNPEADDSPVQLMRAVCGMNPLRQRGEKTDQESILCPRCPLAFTSNDAQAPSFEAVALGSFVESGRKEALVAVNGCEGYEFTGITRGTFGRRVLLAEVDGQWKFIRYYPTNLPTLDDAVLKLSTPGGGTDVFFSQEIEDCRMGSCSGDWRLTRLTKKSIERKVVFSFDHGDTQWSWSKPVVSEDGTLLVKLVSTQGEGEYSLEWKWDGEELTLQRDEVSSLRRRDVSAKEVEGRWRGTRSYD